MPSGRAPEERRIIRKPVEADLVRRLLAASQKFSERTATARWTGPRCSVRRCGESHAASLGGGGVRIDEGKGLHRRSAQEVGRIVVICRAARTKLPCFG